MSVEVEYDNRNITKIINKIKNKTKVVKVGFLQEDVAKIAIINEYGAVIKVTEKMRQMFFAKWGIQKSNNPIIIPPRPFMEMTYNKYKKKWVKYLNTLVVKNNYDIVKALELVGEMMQRDIQITIKEGDFAPNAPLTEKIKGKNKPLINTGNMLQSVQYEIK